ncbi:uncharacterized protein LOC124165379 [Ischnura elegans]|uniref:uncharacterized protein LOC124165379 n=1 Tax=Ischnura elegans TaxID=197161 RepID=UPI001ED88B96|nr:uncharacterized protein LOC124165379 [Ischnura elegans]
MEYRSIYILFLLSSLCVGIQGHNCTISVLFECGKDETCEQVNDSHGVCKCRPGFRRAAAGNCNPLPPSQTSIMYPAEKQNAAHYGPPAPHASPEKEETSESSVSGSSIALGTIIPILLIGGAVALVYSARRYKWHERVRRIGMRRYDEVFIGRAEEEDDDAPIA